MTHSLKDALSNLSKKAPEALAEEGVSLLDKAVAATKSSDRSHVEDILSALTAQALSGTVTWNTNLTETIAATIRAIDAKISKQVTEVLHAPELQQLEGSWRGLEHLVANAATGDLLKVRLFNASKADIEKDFKKVIEPTQSMLFQKIYEDEFGTPGGEPYGLLVGDYEFANSPKDIDFLRKMSGIAATAFAPFISAASSQSLFLENWKDLSKIKDLDKLTKSHEFNQWNQFRDSEDAAFVTLAMPRVLARLPYNSKTNPVEGLDYNEVTFDKNGRPRELKDEDFVWMNAAYVLATKMAESFEKTGFCTAIRGVEGGGKVTGLNTYHFVSDAGEMDLKCPTEIAITDRREKELSNAGFMPLSHFKNTDYAVYMGAQTVQRPKEYEDNAASEDAQVAAKLPYIMVASRIAHYVKIMARDKIGSLATIGEVEAQLNKWIMKYVNTNAASGQNLRYLYPLEAAQVSVVSEPGKVGVYNAVVNLKPWLPLEELNASIRLVANVPGAAGGEGASA
jgi:type VI secretion system protein ImpC